MCHLRVVPPGQLLRRPSTPKRFCLLPFIKPGFSIFLTWSFFVFAFRWLRVFHWGCYVYFRIVFKFFIYSLYIHIYIFYIFFHRTHCRSTHNSSTICFFLCLQCFLFGILVLDGMSERNHCHIIIFSLHCFNCFSVASWRIMQHVIEKPLPYN